VTDAPLIPASLYGLRSWRWASDDAGEWLTGVTHRVRWPSGGQWARAACESGGAHEAPDPGCDCGIYGLHPRRSAAARVLARRAEVPGIVEAAGAVELHEDGFRAERGRPYALVVLPGRNARLIERLAWRYGAEVVRVRGPDTLLAWCRDRGLGLDQRLVDDLLGPEALRRREARRREARRGVVRIVAALLAAVVLMIVGAHYVTDTPGHDVYGRTGKVQRR
jgi:hypothetical protein